MAVVSRDDNSPYGSPRAEEARESIAGPFCVRDYLTFAVFALVFT